MWVVLTCVSRRLTQCKRNQFNPTTLPWENVQHVVAVLGHWQYIPKFQQGLDVFFWPGDRIKLIPFALSQAFLNTGLEYPQWCNNHMKRQLYQQVLERKLNFIIWWLALRSEWLDVCVGGSLRANLVFGFSVGQGKKGNWKAPNLLYKEWALNQLESCNSLTQPQYKLGVTWYWVGTNPTHPHTTINF